MNTAVVSVEFINGLGVVTIDNPPVNTITAAVRDGLAAALTEIEARSDLHMVWLRCAGSTFCSGADIGEFDGPPKEAEYRALFSRLEQLPVPVVAAMHGTVMGGGLEMALACHYRVAAPGTRFALPEVTLGIIPGAGGTQRMPRLVGADRALEMIISAKPVDTAAAIEAGFLDAVIDGDVMPETFRVSEPLAADKGLRRTPELVVDPATGTAEIFDRHTAQARKMYPNRQAALTAIDAVRASLTMPFADGLDYETELVNRAKTTIESKALVHVFFAERETRKVPGMPADLQAPPVKSAAVIGAGTMGGGIAICFANAGIPVTVVDTDEAALQRGLGVMEGTLESMVRRGRITSDEKQRRFGLIRGTLSYDDLHDADVVIEAVYENLELKQQIFRRLDAVVKPGALLASNTSTLDVAAIATAVREPGNVLGLHFFSPANVMPLLEVVRTDLTSPAAIRAALDLAKPLRKTPVLARVCYGFIGNRMMEGYAREAERMVLEGAAPRQVDTALEQWGMAMGILAVFDMAGVDIGVNIHKVNAERYPPDPSYYHADFALVAAGRFGQKNGRGYYRYETGDRTRHDDQDAIAILRDTAQRLEIPQRQHDDTEILERCLYPLLNEGFRVLEEGVAIRASDIDVVWTSGYGFPRYRGGPMFYAETIGLRTLYDGMLKYRQQFGPMHWEPAPLLRQLVERNQTLAQWQAAQQQKVHAK